MFNKDEFAGKWKQVRGHAQQWWGKLTDDDLERVGGKWEQFVGVLQAKYGSTRETIEAEFTQRLTQFESRQRNLKRGNQAPILDIVEGQWKQMHSQARLWWDKLTDDELDKTAGKAEAVFGLLQAEYGYSRDRAEAEFKRRLKEYAASQKTTVVPDQLFSDIETPGLFS
jgi:uncharacterized protein YjbJ (UPF0337 family)